MEELSMDWPPTISSLEPLRPLSPLSSELLEEHEIADVGLVGKLSRSEIAGKLLDHLDELNKGEPEPFDWFATEKSIDLPLFDNVPSPTHYKPQNNVKHFHNYPFQTTDIKNEQCSTQEYLYDTVQLSMYSMPVNSPPALQCQPGNGVAPVPATDWLKAENLTPPDSPKDEEILKLLQEFEPTELEQLVMARKMLQEIEPDELEQLVMTRVDDDTPGTFSENSCSVEEFSDAVSSPFMGSDTSVEDPEWSPPRSVKPGCHSTIGGSKRKSKPYSRPAPEERKLRKKEQNKNAATRYRLKKKAEVEEIRMEEKQLEDKNKQLRNQLDDISREVKYLKSLMRDVYRKKGLIK